MIRIGHHALPLALVVAALALVTSACQAVLEPPADVHTSPVLHPIPPPARAQARAALRQARPLPDVAREPPEAALAAIGRTAEPPVVRWLRRPLETGTASWYGPGFAGRPTASGEIYDPQAMTAAHPALPLGTEVVVVNLENGREARLRINDRGPYVGDRVIDVSKAAAKVLGFYYTGLAEVRVELVEPVRTVARRLAPA